ncbi:MAG TPA: 2TM domain-containing protein [Actinomycetota bacterium]
MVETREDEEVLREQAVERLKRKRDFTAHLLAYVMVNTVLIVVWAMTGAAFFWPIFPLAGWGVGLGFHAWDTFSRPPSEERIREEMDHLRAA